MDPEAANQLAGQLTRDGTAAALAEMDRALLDYATRLTRQPWSVTNDHVEDLRRAGLDDRAIHDLCAIVAYYAFANRIANGLGIDVETA